MFGWVGPANVNSHLNPQSKKISVTNGTLRVDVDGDGKIVVDRFAPESADAQEETVVFRVGAAYSRYHARGFEILGMNNDDDPAMIRDSLKKNGLAWPQAAMESIRDVEIRYRIHLFPTSLLIGPDGKILIVGQRKMRGQDLLKTLDKILPL